MKITSFLLAAAMSVTCQAADLAPANPECIGYASLDGSSNIKLNLISTEPGHGGAMLVLDKAHPLYKEVRKHVPGLRPRIWKCVKLWKDKVVIGVDAAPGADERQTSLLKR